MPINQYLKYSFKLPNRKLASLNFAWEKKHAREMCDDGGCKHVSLNEVHSLWAKSFHPDYRTSTKDDQDNKICQ